MPRSGGVYSKPAGTTAVSGTTIESSKYNQLMDDIVTDLNDARPVTAGGTGATTAGGAQTALKIAPYDGSATITGTWDMSGATLTMPTAMEVLNGSSITGLSGSDVTLITGTAGTDGYVPAWNADGDIVDGYEVLDEDDMASDSATKLATQQSIKAYVDSRVLSESYASTGQTMTAGGLITLAHGLSSIPKVISLYAKCTSADSGYSVDDIIDLSASWYPDTATSTTRAGVVRKDATNIYIRVGADPFITALTADGTSRAGLDATKWDLYVEAYA